MATSEALAGLPSSGTFPISLSPAFLDNAGAKKRRRETDQVLAMKYSFKPASVTGAVSGRLDVETGKAKQLNFDIPSGSRQVFDVREEVSKPRECVLVWDEAKRSFTLHPLPTTLHLTINRSLSNPRARPSAAQLSSSQTAVNASKTPSEASSSSSSSIPLAAKRKQTERNDIELEADSQSSGSGEARMEASSVLGLEEDTPRPKKPRSTLGQGADASFDTSPLAQPAQAARPKHGGKSLPRKAPLMASAPIPNVSGGGGGGSSSRTSRSAKARGSTLTSPKKTAKKPAGGRGKKGAAVPAPVTPVARGKIKSAEIIEDSDIDSNGEGEVEEEEDDLFAKLVGESLAEDEGPSVPTTTGGHDHDAYAEEDEDDDEEEEEDEDEENELGGARLVADQHSEWL